jgi:hypothetical protein
MASIDERRYISPVNDLIDIRGASGASYRFRRVQADESLPAMSGNFLYLREEAGTLQVVGSGTADGLSQARERWPEAVRQHQAEAIFVRLNLSRRLRLAEHADIAAQHNPPMVLAEEGDVQRHETG